MLKVETILRDVVTRAGAWQWMRNAYLPTGPICPGCSAVIATESGLKIFTSDPRGQIYCPTCGTKFLAALGTPIYHTSWQPEEFIQVLILSLAGCSTNALAAHLGKSSHAVRDLLDRIALNHPRPDFVSSTPCLADHSIGIKRARGEGGGDEVSLSLGVSQ